MKREIYTVAVMPSSGRRIRTFSISMHSLILILISSAIIVTSSLAIGSVATWRYFRKQRQLAVEAIENSEALQKEFQEQIQGIRKSYSDFRVILGIETPESDDEAGKGGPEMPELDDLYMAESYDALADGEPADPSSLLKEAASLKSDLDDLIKAVDETIIEAAVTPSIWPVKFEQREQLWISSGFGRRRNPFTKSWEMHEGVDIPCPRGVPVIATADGNITKMGKDGYLGNHIEIQHGEKFSTLYGHMHRFAKGIKKGTRVVRGDVIGYVGRTGRTTGTHVHYEVRAYGKHVDPRDYILN